MTFKNLFFHYGYKFEESGEWKNSGSDCVLWGRNVGFEYQRKKETGCNGLMILIRNTTKKWVCTVMAWDSNNIKYINVRTCKMYQLSSVVK